MSLLSGPQPSTTKEKMLKAQALIKEKRYTDARRILNTINHPTAREWLAKLDHIAPVDESINEPPINVRPAKTTLATLILPAITGIIGLLAGLVIGAIIFRSSTPALMSTNDDCGFNEWWTFAAPDVVDYMGSVNAAFQAQSSLFFDLVQSTMDESQENFERRDYPICAKPVFDAISAGMSTYGLHMSNVGLAILNPDEYGDYPRQTDLDFARTAMKEAATLLRERGQESDFLLEANPPIDYRAIEAS